MTWTPLLNGDQRERAHQIVGAIAADLKRRFDVSAGVSEAEAWSLATGRSGVALFFAYYGTALGDDNAHALAARLVEESLEAATGGAAVDYLFEGFTGVAWTLAHVDGWLLDVSDGDPNDAIDAALLDLTLGAAPWSGEYDLLAGLTGIGVYALERLRTPRGKNLLAAVVCRLSELAEQDTRHPFWWTPSERLPAHVRPGFPDGAWNLGAAHGAPGVIALLAKADAAGVTTARPLLDRAVDWLLTQRLPAEAGSVFPSFQAPDVVSPRRSPLAWCYGDPGAAGALFVAARHAAASGWEAEATAIAERAAGRPVSESRVGDASICHGSAGLAHIFNRLQQATGSAVLRAAAEGWIRQIMDAWRPGVGLGGFLTADHAQGRLTAQSGFLTGAAGIGLVLLAAATPIEPRWDRVYLLS
jgi:lantibiotic modifying enzyme